ncbi:MAG TPA: hypothetical protein VFD15_02480 [Clostridia bacterium]|nr:hypothetical protein [Clostridia bacterium]
MIRTNLAVRTLALAAMLAAPLFLLYQGAIHNNPVQEAVGWAVLFSAVGLNLLNP